jgi:hypothetical protein
MAEIYNLSKKRREKNKKNRNLKGYSILASTYTSDILSIPFVANRLAILARTNPGKMMNVLDDALNSLSSEDRIALGILYSLQGEVYGNPEEAFVKAGLINDKGEFDRFRDRPLARLYGALERILDIPFDGKITMDDPEITLRL